MKLGRTASDEIHDYLKTEIARLASGYMTEDCFDRNFLSILDSICKIAGENCPEVMFTFGRAQKIANIYLKFAYTSVLVGATDEMSVLPWIRLRKLLHIPVDRQTLRFLYFRPYDSRLSRTTRGKFMSWKWDLQDLRYLEIQRRFRYLAENLGYSEALHLEMDKVWTQPAGLGANHSKSMCKLPRQ